MLESQPRKEGCSQLLPGSAAKIMTSEASQVSRGPGPGPGLQSSWEGEMESWGLSPGQLFTQRADLFIVWK